MIVAVDARHLAGGRGVAHYTAALLTGLARQDPADTFRAYVPRHPPGVRPLEWGRVSFSGGRVPSRVVFGSAALVGRPRIDRLVGGSDVVWVPAPAPVAISPGVPYVLTMHDTSWLDRPADFTRYERLWHRLARIDRLVARAAAVVCVSAETRDAVRRHFAVDAERLHVVRSGVDPPAGLDEPPARTRPFFLAVGALEPRKAPDLLARAHALARRDGLQADLVFAGAGRLADAVRGDGVEVLGRVATLGALYRDALALVMPSHLEGFGFPPLEAALAGTPSIVADLPVYDETLGDATLRFAPGDERALADALLRIEREAPVRSDLAARAQAAAGQLTWERTAREFRTILLAATTR